MTDQINLSSKIDPGLEIGDELTQDRIENVFNTKFGFQFKGINPRSVDGQKYIILNSNQGNVYQDQVSSDKVFYYIGEGLPKKGDQEKTPANKALIKAVDQSLPIYLFTSEDGKDKYNYEGLVDVLDYKYVSNGERKVFKFKMQKLEIANFDIYEKIQNRIHNSVNEEPQLTENISYEDSSRIARKSAFSSTVKEAYEKKCAICGEKRLSPTGKPEVEAAHIYPKSEGGSDDIRNSLALCRFHHWAFDNGWFCLRDDLTIKTRKNPATQKPEEIKHLEGNRLSKTPAEDSLKPSKTFVRAHRKLQGFTDQEEPSDCK